ncbi:MAG: tetrahydrofolate dehydrogenase/cyclohydrolase catalytic domain-containing protein [Pseudomonadota bacterium]
MAARIIDGKAAAAVWRAETAAAIAADRAARPSAPPPALRVLLVGDHPASRAYVSTKARVGAEVGVDAQIQSRPADLSTDDLLADIAALNSDPLVHGVLVQLPLPPQIDAGAVLDAIDPAKDVDGFHPLNVGRLHSGAPVADLLAPCTPLGCLRLLEAEHGRDGLGGLTAVVIGRSNIVGKPMAALLTAADCTVTVAHSRTRAAAVLARTADILVAAVGRPGFVAGDWIKPGATVIDVGINRVATPDGKGRLVGDVDFEAATAVAGAITPVPGGVGPMTVAGLMRNVHVAWRTATA